MDPLGDTFCTPRRAVIPDKNFGLSALSKPFGTKSSFSETNESDQDDVRHFLPSNCLIPDCATIENYSRPCNKPFLLQPRFRTHSNNIWVVRDNRKLAANLVEPEEQDELNMTLCRPKRERSSAA